MQPAGQRQVGGHEIGHERIGPVGHRRRQHGGFFPAGAGQRRQGVGVGQAGEGFRQCGGDPVGSPFDVNPTRFGMSGQPAGGEVFLEELMDVEHFVPAQVFFQHAQRFPGFQHVVGAVVREQVEGVRVADAHLGGFARLAAGLHLESQVTQLVEQDALPGQFVGCLPSLGLAEPPAVALAEQRARLKQRVVGIDLALQGLPGEAAEQGGAALRDFAGGGLGDQQLEKIGRAQHLPLRRARQIAPERGVVVGAVERQKLLDLRIGQRLDAHLRHRQVLGGQGGAVVQAAAGEDRPVAGMTQGQVGQKGFPAPQRLRAGLGHLVEGVQQQGDAPLPQERVQRRQAGVFGRPPFAQPVERARRGVGAARAVAVQRDEKSHRARSRIVVRAGGERGPGVVQLEMPQQRALARARRSQQHQRRVGRCRQRLAQIPERAGLRRPARALRLLALVEQQGQVDEAFVQRVARLRPAVDARFAIAPEGRPAGGDAGVRRAYRGRLSSSARSSRPM